MSDNVEMKTASHLGKRRSRSPCSTHLVKKDAKRQEYETYGFYDWREVLMKAIYEATKLPIVLVAMIVEDVPDFIAAYSGRLVGIRVLDHDEGVWTEHFGKMTVHTAFVNGRKHGRSFETDECGCVRTEWQYVNDMVISSRPERYPCMCATV